ncbi:Gfo/Idh/MocA family oxidoreductase [Jiella endophytica]|uniref:Gfo/Idh/MocA family oxidoreductase n=1 Tax=Jiella endophytica TaxID=2558362 RepID=A0A4Y8RRT3_9HYPH|nr:Gfo/Idh/MocA family oxidoreductase [Jiella endophytica]TFF20729.1 Gfo/Idh/MocA family oxidoreductase [Jiella endophytica]TFF27030.1 Gfo/Idh/MocA family oxidoreductase [Jiella endophytica]
MASLEGKIRYGVVGGGWISQAAFMPGVGQTSNSLMTAIVTGDRAKGEELGKHYGLDVYGYDDYEAMLKSGKVDAVYVATPNFRHREFAEPALKAGIHVLLEKPMEVSVEDAEAIEAATKASGARLMIAYRLHCEPGTVAMVEAVRKGEIGKPRFFTSTFSQTVKASNHRATSGYWAGPVPDMGTYPINAVRNLFEAEPVEVMAFASRTDRGLGCDDTVSVILKFTEARQASFTLSYSSEGVDQAYLVGTEGAMNIAPAFGFGAGTAITYDLITNGETTHHEAPVVDQFAGETEYFSDCILEGRDPEPNGEEGVLDMIVLAAIERAIETGEAQKLEPRSRQRRIGPDQTRELKLAKSPDLVGIDVPME